jgi:hypothetical protein
LAAASLASMGRPFHKRKLRIGFWPVRIGFRFQLGPGAPPPAAGPGDPAAGPGDPAAGPGDPAAGPGGDEPRAVDAIRAIRRDRAPDSLRAQVERLRREYGHARARRSGWRPLAVGAPVLAALAAVVALALPGGTPGSPSVGLAARLAVRGPAAPGPPPDPSAPTTQLAEQVQGIAFPNWSRLGWRAAGWRRDRLAGRLALTVYYVNGGRRIAYTILDAPALRWPQAPATTYRSTRFETLKMSDRLVVTWRRAGHTCILSGAGVSRAGLLVLAAWRPHGGDASPPTAGRAPWRSAGAPGATAW